MLCSCSLLFAHVHSPPMEIQFELDSPTTLRIHIARFEININRVGYPAEHPQRTQTPSGQGPSSAIVGALALQNSMRTRISEGWKPATPLARGGQLPLIEPSFKVECFSKPALKREWKFFKFREACVIYDVYDADDDINEEEISSSSLNQLIAPIHQTVRCLVRRLPPSLWISCGHQKSFSFRLHRSTWHIMSTTAVEGDIPCTNEARRRTACGRHLMAGRVELHIELQGQKGQSICLHPGCRKGLASLNLV